MLVARWSRLTVDTVEFWQSDWNVKVSLLVSVSWLGSDRETHKFELVELETTRTSHPWTKCLKRFVPSKTDVSNTVEPKPYGVHVAR